ncbi:HIT-like protein, partial [Marasmius fiardii PR-910]
FAFLDIMPTAEGHTQVIPKYHAETIADLPDEYLADIGPTVKKIALATGAQAYNIVQVGLRLSRIHSRRDTFRLHTQHVPHVHFHVIPKPNETEGLVLTLGQNWPQKKVDTEVLAATCAKMTQRL